jgi:hypothetical protein
MMQPHQPWHQMIAELRVQAANSSCVVRYLLYVEIERLLKDKLIDASIPDRISHDNGTT